MPFVLALDCGTTSARAIIFDRAGLPVGAAQREFAQHFPHPGWVEHDPLELWAAQHATACDALRDAGVASDEIAAIGIANQRETTILWERRTGVPVANAIVWQDRRTADACAQYRARGVGEIVSAKTGLVLDPYFSATKIAWLLDHVAGLRARAEAGEIAFGTVDSWLVWKLTGGARHVTDMTNASRTMLFDIHALSWSDELLGLFDIPRAILPEVLPCTADFGTTAPGIFATTIPITGVVGDQHAALLGQGGFDAGVAKNTYGTGSFVLLNTGDRVVTSGHGLISTLAFAFERTKATYALEGSIFITGAAVQWLRDGLAFIERSSEIEALAATVDDNGGVYFVPAFSGLAAPYWDPYARGTIVGLDRSVTRAHIARAALEAMAYQSVDVIAAMEADAGRPIDELRVDGGASANDFAMQFQADMLGRSVARGRTVEATALGAAYAAGLQCGFWSGLDALRAQWREDRRFEPQRDHASRAVMMRRWHDAVERSRGWATPLAGE